MSSSNKIPRIELTRERSSTLESIQSLTRAIRESLRLHSVRREKKRRQKKSSKAATSSDGGGLLEVKESKRGRSKSMDCNQDSEYNEEISDVGISGVVVSDFGPNTPNDSNLTAQVDETSSISDSPNKEASQTKPEEAVQEIVTESSQHRRHSKSVDEIELAHIRKPEKMQAVDASTNYRRGPKNPQKSLDISTLGGGKMGMNSRQLSMPDSSGERRKSRDDSPVTKSDAKHLRSRFAHLLDTLRSHKFSLSSIDDNSIQDKSQE